MLDKVAFVARCMGDVEFAMQVLTEFMGQLPIAMERLEQCVDANDTDELLRQAHTIKGLAANVSAEAFSTGRQSVRRSSS